MKSIHFYQRRLLSLSFIFGLCFLWSCSKNPVTGKNQFNLMGEGQEIAMGKQTDPQIVAMYGKYDDAQLQSFIDQKGQAMARISHRNHLKYEFKILDSPVVNAFAVPGGYVYFTRGIMAHFNNEAEFMGVLGHEIGHIAARHSAQQYSNQMLGQALLIGGLIASPEFAQFGNEAIQGLQLLFMSFSRSHESESDELGVEYSTKVGYDSHQMADFFQTLKQLSAGQGQSIPTFLSTHPDPQNRYNNVHKLSDKMQDPNKSYKVERDNYLRMIDGIVYGDDPRQGYVQNGYFYHPDMKFQYKMPPSSWQYVNTPSQVQMGEPEGLAAMYLSLGSASSLNQSLQNDLESNQLTLVDQDNRSINGNPALVAIAEQQGQDQQSGQTITVRAMLTYIQYGSYVLRFDGVTHAQNYSRFRNIFESTAFSFSKLTDSSKINVKPERIKIQQLSSSMTLSSALGKYGIPADRRKEFAILNGMDLNENLPSGTLIKTLQ